MTRISDQEGAEPSKDSGMPGPMSGKVARGASWSATGRLGAQALQFLAGLALARLLLPEDFGLLATVYVVTGLTVLFFDMGLANALVFQRQVRDDDLSTAFWLNAIGGIVFVGALVLLAPGVSAFFDDERLVYLTPLAGLPFLFNLAVSHTSLLLREMRFKAVAGIEIAGALLSNGATVAAAFAGWGPIALIVGPPLGALLVTALTWFAAPWKPKSFISVEAVRRLWNFSGGLFAFSLVNYAGRNSDNFLIARFQGPEVLGYYNRAFNLMLLPLQQVGGVVGRVMFPALASMGSDLTRVQGAYRRVMKATTALTAPLLLGLAATAAALVPFLWGPGWEPTVPLLQILCLAGLPQVFSSSEGWVYQSQGRTFLMSFMGLISTVAGIVGIVIGLSWGAQGVAWGIFATAYLFLPINLQVACSVIGLTAAQIYRDNVVTMALAISMAAIVWLVPICLGWERSSPMTLLVQILVGVASYSLGMIFLRRALVRDLIGIIRSRA